MKTWKERLNGAENLVMNPRTLVEIYGQERLLVEHHRGIVSYGNECIRIKATFGELVVEGADLRLCCMSRSQLVIRGRLLCLRLEGGQ